MDITWKLIVIWNYSKITDVQFNEK